MIFFAIIVAIIGYIAWRMRPKPPVYEYVTVGERDIIQEVSVTGSVTPEQDVSLAFQTQGRVSKTYVNVGDTVKEGDVLAKIQATDIEANLAQANAMVDAQKAQLRQLQSGTRPEQVDVQKVQLANAQTAYINAEDSVITSIGDAYTKTDDAIRNKADKFFINPRSGSPTLSFSLNNFSLANTLQAERKDMEIMLVSWKSDNDKLSGQNAETNVGLVKDHLLQARTFLDNCALALSIVTSDGVSTQTTVDGWKSDTSISRTSINTAISALQNADDALSSAKSAIDLANSNLTLSQAPALSETVSAQVAAVEQAQANVRAIEANLEKTILRSPIGGVVTSEDTKAGEIVSPNVPIISIISKNQLLIEAYIPEADIAKITLGDKASVTLDAYGDAVKFTATAISVDPAETMLQGVATYKTKFRFDQADEKIKPGMTANIDIKTARHNGVIAIPQRDLIRNDTGTFAQILEAEKVKNIPVTTGLRGSDGYTEILSGLKEGQKIIVPSII